MFDSSDVRASYVMGLLGTLVALWQIAANLAPPSATRTRELAGAESVRELSAADLRGSAEASEEEAQQFLAACLRKRQLQTAVGNSGWIMNDMEATRSMCECARQHLAVTSSRIEWLVHYYGELSDYTNLRAVEARIERLGKTRSERQAMTQEWRNRGGKVFQECRT